MNCQLIQKIIKHVFRICYLMNLINLASFKHFLNKSNMFNIKIFVTVMESNPKHLLLHYIIYFLKSTK